MHPYHRAGHCLCFNVHSNSGFPFPRAILGSATLCWQLLTSRCHGRHKPFLGSKDWGFCLTAVVLLLILLKNLQPSSFYGLQTEPGNSWTLAHLSKILCSPFEKGAAPLPPFLKIISEKHSSRNVEKDTTFALHSGAHDQQAMNHCNALEQLLMAFLVCTSDNQEAAICSI